MKKYHSLLIAVCLPLGAMAAPATISKHYPPLDWEPYGTHGQALVDQAMAQHPEIKLITVHVTAEGVPADDDTTRAIWFSSIGRLGKLDSIPSAWEDIKVYHDRKEVVKLLDRPPPPEPYHYPTATPKYEVMAPMYDKTDTLIGIAVFAFPYKKGDDAAKYHDVVRQVLSDWKATLSRKDDLWRPAAR